MTYSIEQQKQSAELVSTLARKAQESSAFKEQLINDPTAAIREVTGKNFTIPENHGIIVEDQTDESIIYLNIPTKPDLDSLELTEEQLELLSGGTSPGCYVGAVALGYGVCWLIDHVHISVSVS